MALEKITNVSGRVVPIPGDDVDTDRIIPARFMKCVTFDGLGEYAFYDVRFDAEGNRKAHPLNDERFAGASIMLAGSNFGCGSSREHAPQSLHKSGVRAIVAQSFAEIFFGNSITLGMPCVTVDAVSFAALNAAVQAQPAEELSIDLEAMQLTFAGQTYPCAMPQSAREGLLNGTWDPIALMLQEPEAVEAVAKAQHYVQA